MKQSPLSKFGYLLHIGFIAPFRSYERFLVYIAAIIGSGSVMAASFLISFNLFFYGPLSLLGYFVIRFMFANLFWLPYLLYAFEKYKLRHFIIPLAIIKIAALGLFLSYHDFILTDINFTKGALLAVLNIIMSATFWLFHHRLMIEYLSDDNHGNDISVAEFALNIGALIGAVAGGWAVAAMGFTGALVICFVLMMAAIIIYFHLMARRPLEKKPFAFFDMYKTIFENISRSSNMIVFSANHFLLYFFAPVWMAAIGLSSIKTGIVIALQSLIKFLASPIVGYLTNRNKGEETLIGATSKTLGWLPWLFSQSQILLIPSSILWFIGSHFYNVGAISRWYKGRSGKYIGASEICRGIGRISASLILIPLLYYSHDMFFVACFMLASLGMVSSKVEKRFLN